MAKADLADLFSYNGILLGAGRQGKVSLVQRRSDGRLGARKTPRKEGHGPDIRSLEEEVKILRDVVKQGSVNTVLPLAVVMDGNTLDSLIFKFCEETLAQRFKLHDYVMPPEVTSTLLQDPPWVSSTGM